MEEWKIWIRYWDCRLSPRWHKRVQNCDGGLICSLSTLEGVGGDVEGSCYETGQAIGSIHSSDNVKIGSAFAAYDFLSIEDKGSDVNAYTSRDLY